MEINHKSWTSSPEWLGEVQLATLTETSPNLWAEKRESGDGPPCRDCNGVPRYRRADVEAWLISRSIQNTSQRGRP